MSNLPSFSRAMSPSLLANASTYLSIADNDAGGHAGRILTIGLCTSVSEIRKGFFVLIAVKRAELQWFRERLSLETNYVAVSEAIESVETSLKETHKIPSNAADPTQAWVVNPAVTRTAKNLTKDLPSILSCVVHIERARDMEQRNREEAKKNLKDATDVKMGDAQQDDEGARIAAEVNKQVQKAVAAQSRPRTNISSSDYQETISANVHTVLGKCSRTIEPAKLRTRSRLAKFKHMWNEVSHAHQLCKSEWWPGDDSAYPAGKIPSPWLPDTWQHDARWLERAQRRRETLQEMNIHHTLDAMAGKTFFHVAFWVSVQKQGTFGP
ncbi:hypothetical protein SERLA73DRAFT_154406 [Serpula lacrymans var. lacrymans S7.3]|uniref:Uncharacterized protein n=1 Tax=Serpula lacrymans var. lacrymans (strain S7.3) TaxID=936435 RepID=F8Q4K6_SERL3|nr:hypothetical protein SERLA73DRAFT_154406 [Serpula lacrymans var. lacrymans S7.3]